MKKLDLKVPHKIKALFYGPPGSYKTRTVYSAAKDERFGRVLGIDAGGNPLSIRDYPTDRLDILSIGQLSDLNTLHGWLKNGQKKDSSYAQRYELQPPYQTLVFDGISHIQQMSLWLALGSELEPGSMPNKVEWGHWDKILGQMSVFAYEFLLLDMHVLLTALEWGSKETEGGPSVAAPLLKGQAAELVPSYCYLVGRMMHISRAEASVTAALTAKLREVKSVAVFKPDKHRRAKDQYGTVGDLMANPTMKDIYDKIYPNG